VLFFLLRQWFWLNFLRLVLGPCPDYCVVFFFLPFPLLLRRASHDSKHAQWTTPSPNKGLPMEPTTPFVPTRFPPWVHPFLHGRTVLFPPPLLQLVHKRSSRKRTLRPQWQLWPPPPKDSPRWSHIGMTLDPFQFPTNPRVPQETPFFFFNFHLFGFFCFKVGRTSYFDPPSLFFSIRRALHTQDWPPTRYGPLFFFSPSFFFFSTFPPSDDVPPLSFTLLAFSAWRPQRWRSWLFPLARRVFSVSFF